MNPFSRLVTEFWKVDVGMLRWRLSDSFENRQDLDLDLDVNLSCGPPLLPSQVPLRLSLFPPAPSVLACGAQNGLRYQSTWSPEGVIYTRAISRANDRMTKKCSLALKIQNIVDENSRMFQRESQRLRMATIKEETIDAELL